MKKLFISIISIIVAAQTAYAFEALPVNPGVNSAGAINARDVQMLREQQFRRQEYDDFKSIKEVKEKHQKELESTTIPESSLFEKMINRKTPAQFVEKDGQIKIEHME